MADTAVTIVVVRPGLLGTYGDGGNALVLRERLRLRGVAAHVLTVDGAEPVPQGSDIILLGGGEDDAQRVLAGDAHLSRDLFAAVRDGATVLAVCGGYQLLGSSFVVGASEIVSGFGLLDVHSDRLRDRAVGEVVAFSTLPGLRVLTGFENHAGRTTLGPDARPLGRLVQGTGNGTSNGDGAVQGGIIGTYLHGPVLARNPDLADFMLERVVGPLPPFEDQLADALRRERIDQARSRKAKRLLRGER
jgi:CobQ-like glutamine amidotransferase family enzyme